MRYVLNRKYRFRGWNRKPACLLDTETMDVRSMRISSFILLMKCDGAHDIDPEALSETEQKDLKSFLENGWIQIAQPGQLLKEEQVYRTYPAPYRREAQWSVTGACNLNCRHCFMSAPHVRHGVPSQEELLRIADQLAECGVFHVCITGGEPLIRKDFMTIIDALNEREIQVRAIYTNGWLIDENFLDELEARKVHPQFQLSFDGVGCHDFLRGVEGSEERAVRALRLLQKRGYEVSVSMCLHKKNAGSIRRTVKFLAETGVRSVKISTISRLGEWADRDLSGLQMTEEEAYEAVMNYIPQYFEDDAPVSVLLCGCFQYRREDEVWDLVPVGETGSVTDRSYACQTLQKSFYIGADGMVTPCMGMADTESAGRFPNLKELPLSLLLNDSAYVSYAEAIVGDVRDGNEQCRSCEYVSCCNGGCRQNALVSSQNYYAPDPVVCMFHKHGWYERMREVIEPAYEAYMRRRKRSDSRQ
ncbi:MAG: radical SAM protein [Solobacterium sp.]|nr:radical SAM protein [Solobacterium sp.]